LLVPPVAQVLLMPPVVSVLLIAPVVPVAVVTLLTQIAPAHRVPPVLLDLLLDLLRVLEMPVALCGVDPGVSRENAWSGGAMCQRRSMLSGGRRMRV